MGDRADEQQRVDTSCTKIFFLHLIPILFSIHHVSKSIRYTTASPATLALTAGLHNNARACAWRGVLARPAHSMARAQTLPEKAPSSDRQHTHRTANLLPTLYTTTRLLSSLHIFCTTLLLFGDILHILDHHGM